MSGCGSYFIQQVRELAIENIFAPEELLVHVPSEPVIGGRRDPGSFLICGHVHSKPNRKAVGCQEEAKRRSRRSDPVRTSILF